MTALQALTIALGIVVAFVGIWIIGVVGEWGSERLKRPRPLQRIYGPALPPEGAVVGNVGDLERYRRDPVGFLNLFPYFATEPWQLEALEKLCKPVVVTSGSIARTVQIPKSSGHVWNYPLHPEEALARADEWVQPNEPHFLSELQAEALRKMREDPDWMKDALKPGATVAYFGQRWYDQDGEHEISEAEALSDRIYRWHDLAELIEDVRG